MSFYRHLINFITKQSKIACILNISFSTWEEVCIAEVVDYLRLFSRRFLRIVSIACPLWRISPIVSRERDVEGSLFSLSTLRNIHRTANRRHKLIYKTVKLVVNVWPYFKLMIIEAYINN